MKKKDVLLGLLIFLIIVSGTHLISPFIAGSSTPLIVLSGSMHPYMRVGDMVVVESVKPDDLVVGDVLTFRMPGEDDDVFVTHRIVSIEGTDTLVFQTKGDANEEMDDFQIYSEGVIGKVTFVIPFAGYLPESSKNSSLFFASIIIPSALLIIGEIRTIIKYSNPVKARKDEKEKKKQSRRITYTPDVFRLMSIVLISLIFILFLTVPYTILDHETELTDDYTIENPGFLSSVYVITPDKLTDRLQIEPWYAIIPAGNASTIKVAEEDMHVKVSSVPYVLPMQWIIMLAEKGVYMPAVGVVVLYMAGVMLVTIPLWYRKSVRGEKKRSLRYRVARFKRDIRRMKIIE